MDSVRSRPLQSIPDAHRRSDHQGTLSREVESPDYWGLMGAGTAIGGVVEEARSSHRHSRWCRHRHRLPDRQARSRPASRDTANLPRKSRHNQSERAVAFANIRDFRHKNKSSRTTETLTRSSSYNAVITIMSTTAKTISMRTWRTLLPRVSAQCRRNSLRNHRAEIVVY